MSSRHSQLNLPPMAAHKVGTAEPTASNLVGIVDLAGTVLRAGAQLGMQDKELAALFELSPADFSSAFSPNRPDRNRLMKQSLPLPFAREVALVMCSVTGLTVSGPDAERHALCDVVESMGRYLRVVQR